MRTQVAERWLKGNGLELGALHFPVQVPLGCQVTYVDHLPLETTQARDPSISIPDYPIVLDDAETLLHFELSSQDFIIACHLLEHCHETIGTILRWTEILRVGGILYIALPEKNYTFDRLRAVTPVDHFVDDHLKGESKNDYPHYLEYHRLVDHLTGEELEKRALGTFGERYNIHFHVYDTESMQALFKLPLLSSRLELVEFVTNGAENIIVLRKL